jgi:transposase-like protein
MAVSDNPAFEDEFIKNMLLSQVAHIMETAIRAEVEEFLSFYNNPEDEAAGSRVVHNGYLPERHLQTPLGLLKLNIPRLRDRLPGGKAKFVSRFVPPYARRMGALNGSLGWAYLKGLVNGDFRLAMSLFLTRFTPPVSRSLKSRLKSFWLEDHEDYLGLTINAADYEYFLALSVGPIRRVLYKSLSVLAGVTPEGRGDFLGLAEGLPQDSLSWANLFHKLAARGLTVDPQSVYGGPDLGVWAGLKLLNGLSPEPGFMGLRAAELEPALTPNLLV